jgi:hypothetical protein
MKNVQGLMVRRVDDSNKHVSPTYALPARPGSCSRTSSTGSLSSTVSGGTSLESVVSNDDTPLPPEWEERISKSKGGKTYYYNKLTGQNTWKRPSMANDDASSVSSFSTVSTVHAVPAAAITAPAAAMRALTLGVQRTLSPVCEPSQNAVRTPQAHEHHPGAHDTSTCSPLTQKQIATGVKPSLFESESESPPPQKQGHPRTTNWQKHHRQSELNVATLSLILKVSIAN